MRIGLSLAKEAEVDALLDRATKAGASINTAAAKRPWGYCATIRDPDGHVWMFTTS